MQDHERPSILAVGLPEIFDNAERDSKSSADATVANHIASTSRMTANLSSDLTTQLPSRIDGDPELLRWMVYSSEKQSLALHSEFGAGTDHLSDSATVRDESTCDDSAYGLTLGATAIEAARSGSTNEVSYIYASSAKRAIELLRIMRFDLLVTSDQLPDMAVSQLVGRVRAVRPWQKWALVMSGDVQNGNDIQSEIAARSLGAAAIFDGPGDLEMISELAQTVAARHPAKMAVGMTIGESADAGSTGRSFAAQSQASNKTRKNGIAKSPRMNRAKA